MTALSPELRAFLADWLAWVERGAPDGEPYRREDGLCWNRIRFAGGDSGEIRSAMIAAFRADGLDETFPFGSRYEFWRQQDNNALHECPTRLAWVRAKLAEPVQ